MYYQDVNRMAKIQKHECVMRKEMQFMSKQEKYLVVEWNVNQRSGFSKNNAYIPSFVSDEILSHEADIIILTEFFNIVINDVTKNFLEDILLKNNYSYVMTKNNTTNEILIAWQNKKFHKVFVDDSVVSTKTNNLPNYLRVDLMNNLDEIISVIGTRIRVVDSHERRKEMDFILQKVKNISYPLLIGGDFNNNRRLTVDSVWSLNIIDKMLLENNIKRYTPEGQSIYQESSRLGEAYEFAEDHFFTRGLEMEVDPYDREFVLRAPDTYLYGRNFQMNEYGSRKKWSVAPCNPDHAILKGWFGKVG